LSLHILSDYNSIVNNLIAELRDKNIQKDAFRFRWNMEKTGEIMAYEISRQLEYKNSKIETPLGISRMNILKHPPYIIAILRAAIPFYKGFINIFNHSESGFIGAFRSDQDNNFQFDIEMGYTAIGKVEKKDVILVDPMIATGKSILKAIEFIGKFGQPSKIFIAAILGSRSGYQFLKQNLNMQVEYWFGDLDNELNDKSYIIPGLGDAGDLSFGKKYSS
jgi:uracil phosphoribosyltransferase